LSTPIPTLESFIPPTWQFIISLIVPISVLFGVAVKITNQIGKVEERITSVEQRLEGRINLLDVSISRHPLLTGYKEFERRQAVETIDGFVKKWEEENQRRPVREAEDKK
jgi:hypothetical protein